MLAATIRWRAGAVEISSCGTFAEGCRYRYLNGSAKLLPIYL